MNAQAYRLPPHVRPRRYDISLSARLGTPAFDGSVSISLDIAEASPTITLHARDLRISRATLDAAGGTLSGSVTLDAAREIAIIDFGRPLPTGAATLRLVFDGQINRGLDGLYLASDGPEQLLATQFQATAARAAFPCFDEPAYKAEFAWTVTTAPEATVLANGPLVSVADAPDGSAKTWTFAPSKPMSTYIAALVIGDIAAAPETVVAGTPLRVWAVRGKQQMGQFAQAFTARLLPWYERYFATPYHYVKYDQVAVPAFAAGAMENSGLVLFRQAYLLTDGQTASWAQEKTIAHIVAHEFAHMWFGNLVTMFWWDDLWLNEAFAEWLSIKAVNELAPDYAIWDDFQRTKATALTTDALQTTHPIYTQVATPAEADELFDTITYNKGCAVLRMLENFLGADAFRAGVRTYIHEFAERNAVGADLWRHLGEASNMPVAELMESWITQSGHPLIDVALDAAGQVTVAQTRFFSSADVQDGAAQLWAVPLVVRYADDAGTHTTRFLLRDRSATLPLDIQGTLRWCYANADEVGFYRQRYSAGLRDQLIAHLAELTGGEQMGLLRDEWALVTQGTRTITAFLPLLKALAAVDSYHVVEAVVGYLHAIDDLVEAAGSAATVESFRIWVGELYGARLEAIGLAPQQGESTNVTQQRIALIDALALIAEDEDVLEQATHWAEREAQDSTAVDPNLALSYINAAAVGGDEQRFERHVALYQQRREAASTPQETNRYLQSFPRFRAPELVTSTLELIDQEIIPQESVGQTLVTMLARPHAQRAAWEYITANWQSIRQLGLSWVSNVVEAAGKLPPDMRPAVTRFFDAELNGEAQMAYARAIETMEQQAAFRSHTRDALIRWFAAEQR